MNVPEYVDESVHDLIRSLQPCAIINNRGYGKGDYSTPERSDEEDSYLPFANPVEACDSISMNSWGIKNPAYRDVSSESICGVQAVFSF